LSGTRPGVPGACGSIQTILQASLGERCRTGSATGLRSGRLDAGTVAKDARTALDFYRKGDMDSRWFREAEEILERAQTHEESQG